MKNKCLICTIALTTAFLWSGEDVSAQSKSSSPERLGAGTKKVKPSTQFMKLARDTSGQLESLQTAVTRYRSPDNKLLVDLIAVIHIGEKEYYQKLDHQFTQYDSLLYELVAPEDGRIPKATRNSGGSNPLRLIQGTMQNMLGLHSQLDHINYARRNFVHADLSPGQMKRKLEQRGETPWTFAFKALGEAMQEQNSGSANALAQDIQGFDELFSLMSDSTKLKRLLARQFTAGGMEMGLGKSLNQLLITDRNEAAMKVLNQEIDRGQTKLALFYGAAHMPDFEQRLVTELKLRKTRQVWVDAWDLQSTDSPQNNPIDSLADSLLQLLDEATR